MEGFGYVARRTLLKVLGAMGVLFLLPSWARAYFVPFGFPVRTVEKDNFRFDPKTGTILKDKKERIPYVLTVDGLVEKPLSLSYSDIRALPQIKQVSDFHCVEGWSVKDVKWGGFRLKEITARARPKPEAKYVIFHSLGETESKPEGQAYYIESAPLAELLDEKMNCLMALDLEGKPLPHDHGSPLRLVSPFNLGYKNIKYVRRIEFASAPREGWWTLANPIYTAVAPVPADRLRRKP